MRLFSHGAVVAAVVVGDPVLPVVAAAVAVVDITSESSRCPHLVAPKPSLLAPAVLVERQMVQAEMVGIPHSDHGVEHTVVEAATTLWLAAPRVVLAVGRLRPLLLLPSENLMEQQALA